MSSQFSEDALVEQPAIALFAGLGWETANCFDEKFGENSTHGRETTSEVVLLTRLRSALNCTIISTRLNYSTCSTGQAVISKRVVSPSREPLAISTSSLFIMVLELGL